MQLKLDKEQAEKLGLKEGQIIRPIFEQEEEKELPEIEITEEVRKKIIDFLSNVEIKDDKKDVHKFAEEIKMNAHQLELEIYKIVQTFFMGGRAFEKSITAKDVNSKELKIGVNQIETEHVNTKSPYWKFISERISLDHLSEISPANKSLYNSYLLDMEKQMEKDIEG